MGIINAYGGYTVLWPTRIDSTRCYWLSMRFSFLRFLCISSHTLTGWLEQQSCKDHSSSWRSHELNPKRENVATKSKAFFKVLLRWTLPMSNLTGNTKQLHWCSPFLRHSNHWAKASEDNGFPAFFCFHLMFQCSVTICRKRQRGKNRDDTFERWKRSNELLMIYSNVIFKWRIMF